jgi:hypothetical protein
MGRCALPTLLYRFVRRGDVKGLCDLVPTRTGGRSTAEGDDGIGDDNSNNDDYDDDDDDEPLRLLLPGNVKERKREPVGDGNEGDNLYRRLVPVELQRSWETTPLFVVP